MGEGTKPSKFKGQIDSSKGQIAGSDGQINSSKGSIDSSKGQIAGSKGQIDKKKESIDSGQGLVSSFLLLALALTMIGVLVFALNLNAQANDSQITGLFSGEYLSIDNFASNKNSENTGNQNITNNKITLEPVKAEAIQDQDGTGTKEFDVLDDVSELDDIFAPNCSSKEPCGTVPREYFLTSTSGKYFDSLALEFDTSEYDSDNYDATLRLFVKQGAYRKDNRYHYDLYYFYKDNSICKDTTIPSECKSAEEIEKDFEGWLEIPLKDDWERGNFTVRLWNVLIDKAELYLEEK
ncbi:MAG: hypothetical protein V1672_02810 [Candidatus Diapherotrites archaeon]